MSSDSRSMTRFNMDDFCAARPLTALVVDPDPGMRETTKGILLDLGFGVAVVDDGYEAARMSSKQSSGYDFAFIEFNLPDLKGVEIVRLLQTYWPGTRVVISCASDLDACSLACEEHGLVYLKKPFWPPELEAILVQALSQCG